MVSLLEQLLEILSQKMDNNFKFYAENFTLKHAVHCATLGYSYMRHKTVSEHLTKVVHDFCSDFAV